MMGMQKTVCVQEFYQVELDLVEACKMVYW